MSTQVPYPVFVYYLSPFAPWYDSVIVDDGCLSTVGNEGSKCSVGENTALNETGDASATMASNLTTLDFGFSDSKSMIWSDFVVCVDNDGLIEYERMSSEGGTAEGLVGVSKSKISMELENGKGWQPSNESWDCNFYLYQRAFPETWGAGMQWRLWYVRNMGYVGCQECKNMCRFYWIYCIEKCRDCLIWDTTAF